MRIPFRLLIAILFVLCHLRGIDAPPNGFHKWRETDTATVAENYATESMTFLLPRVNVRGTGNGIVGMELPVYNYAAAALYQAFGFSHAWPRLLSLLSGLLLLYGIHAMTLKLTGNPVTARIAMLLSAFSPLVTFYSAKIQPDVFGLALTVWGFVQFVEWTDRRSMRRLLLAAASLALAGCIKPTFLFVGLPMAWILWTERESGLWRDAAVWMMALAVVAPVGIWLRFARGLSEKFGSTYFYLGGDLLAEMQGLTSPKFYQNTLLTWPWEMALGIPALLIAVLGLRKRVEGGGIMAVWMLGCFVVFALAATHCATPHDYYYLPAVPALIFVSASAATWLLSHPSRWRRVAVTGLLVAAPVYGYSRVMKRFDFSRDFAATRELAKDVVEPGSLVLAVDPIPGDLLYRTGLKGFRVEPPLTEKDLVRLARMGAKYLVVRAGESLLPTSVGRHVGNHVAVADGIAIYSLEVAPVTISMP